MKEKVLKAIEKFSLLDGVERVTVALSGGADSVALLSCLCELKNTLGIEVYAAHFNHLIRGAEADRDEQFAVELCRKLGVEITVKREDVPLFAKENKISTELAARRLRYAFFDEVSKGGAVATAHTASDNLETVIFNLTRGSGAEGLCGIPPKRDKFIRPLIFCTRQDIENYCRENKLDYVTDSTNNSDDYTRNKIRHSVIPVLKEINPEAEISAVRACNALREDNAVLKSAAEKYLSENTETGSLKADGLSSLPPAVAKRVLKKFVSSFLTQSSLDSFHIERLYACALKGGRQSLPENLQAESKNGRLTVKKANERLTENPFTVEIIKEDKKIHNLLLKSSLDCDKIMGKSVFRTRLPGDNIRICGKRETKTLKKLYNEYKIPVEQREFWPVLADDSGVIWIYGIGVAARCAVTDKTKRIIKISVKGNIE
ncbi:MAG: tRNA lysidine(34) synthetase TilS [Clostridia bacterium]|nr:tRNA lysidine(34) synthetase TilS [Clostridia bacterium]